MALSADLYSFHLCWCSLVGVRGLEMHHIRWYRSPGILISCGCYSNVIYLFTVCWVTTILGREMCASAAISLVCCCLCLSASFGLCELSCWFLQIRGRAIPIMWQRFLRELISNTRIWCSLHRCGKVIHIGTEFSVVEKLNARAVWKMLGCANFSFDLFTMVS